MNWQHYQNGHMAYPVPFRPMFQPPVDMASIMQYNFWQSQMNRYSLATHGKISADAIDVDANISPVSSTLSPEPQLSSINCETASPSWQDANMSYVSTALSPESQISLTNCEAASPNQDSSSTRQEPNMSSLSTSSSHDPQINAPYLFPNDECSNESQWHSTVKNSLPPINQINDPMQLSPISDYKTPVSPNSTTRDEWIDWAKTTLAYSDKGGESVWSSDLDICPPSMNNIEASNENLAKQCKKARFYDTNVDLAKCHKNETFAINDNWTENNEKLLTRGNVQSIDFSNTTIDICTPSINAKETVTENLDQNCKMSNFYDTNVDLAKFHKNETVKLNDNCKQNNEELLIEGNVQMGSSSNTDLDICLPSMNDTESSTEYLDQKCTKSTTLCDNNADLAKFHQHITVKINDNLIEKNKELLIVEGFQSIGFSNTKESDISLVENNMTENKSKEHQSSEFIEDSSITKDTQIGFHLETERSSLGGNDSQICILPLHLKRTFNGIWVVKNNFESNVIKSNENNKIGMYDNEKKYESQIPSQNLDIYHEISFKCEICFKSFRHQASMNSHMRVHSDLKPFICNICGKCFKLKNTLSTHVIGQHSTDRPFKCSFCNKSFYQRGALKSHTLTHTGEKPFMCTICGKGFTQSGSLKIHKFTHSENKPFNCTICHKGFIQKSIMKAHMKSRHIKTEI